MTLPLMAAATLTSSDKLVWLYIAQTGTSCREEIAAGTSVSPSTVKRAIKALEREGWLRVTKTGRHTILATGDNLADITRADALRIYFTRPNGQMVEITNQGTG